MKQTARILNDKEWTSLVLAKGRKTMTCISQQPKATRAAFNDFLIDDINSLIVEFVSPFCATVDELWEICAVSRNSRSAARVVKADAILGTDGYYTRGFRHVVVGDSKWPRFLLKARRNGCNVLALIFCTRTEVPIHLLRQIIPQNEENKVTYALQRTTNGASLMVVAARQDSFQQSTWRLKALWTLFPKLCPKMVQTKINNQFPLYHLLAAYCKERTPLKLEVLQQLVLRLLPRDDDQIDDVIEYHSFNVLFKEKAVNLVQWLLPLIDDFDADIAKEIRKQLQRVLVFNGQTLVRHSALSITAIVDMLV